MQYGQTIMKFVQESEKRAYLGYMYACGAQGQPLELRPLFSLSGVGMCGERSDPNQLGSLGACCNPGWVHVRLVSQSRDRLKFVLVFVSQFTLTYQLRMRLIGLQLIGSVLSPFFCIGITFANSQMSGNLPEFKDLLNSIAKDLLI